MEESQSIHHSVVSQYGMRAVLVSRVGGADQHCVDAVGPRGRHVRHAVVEEERVLGRNAMLGHELFQIAVDLRFRFVV